MSIKRMLEGLTLVLVGVILLLNTTGQLPWSVWWSVLSLWPLLLIAAGLDIVAKGLETEWLRVLSSLLIIAGIAVGAFVLPSVDRSPGFGWGVRDAGATFDTAVDRAPRVTEGSATIQGGAGSYGVEAGSADDLVRVRGRSPHGEPRLESGVTDGMADVRVAAPDSGVAWVPHIGGSASVEVLLSPEVVWDLSVDTGAVDISADLSGLHVSGLQMRAGVSSATVRLGLLDRPNRLVPVQVRGGVSSFTLEVPRDVPVRIRAETGLSRVDVDRSIPRARGESREWQSDDWDRSGGYDIEVEAGVSSVRIERY